MTSIQYWVFLTIPAFVVSVWMLARTIRGLVTLMRESIVGSGPWIEEQSVDFAEPGRYDLYVEARRFTNVSGLGFDLLDEDGSRVPLDSSLFRTTVSGVSRVRTTLRPV